MSMTKRDYLAKKEIRNILSQEGYPTYSYLIEDFEIHLTKDPKVIGYMIPNKGVIVLNDGLNLEQVSVIVRHEILHEFFNHAKRFENHVGKDAYDSRDEFTHRNMNIAGDYDISNRGYTETDKKNIRKIRLNGKTLPGLVTEDKHPDWVGLSVEQMYDRLMDQMKQEKEDMKADLDNNRNSNSGSNSQGQQGNQDGDPDTLSGDNNPNSNSGSNSQGQQGNQDGDPDTLSGSSRSSSSNSGNSASNKNIEKSIQIGDQGDPDFQAAEDAEREANAYKEESEDSAQKAKEQGEDKLSKANQDLANKADKLSKDAKDLADDIKQNGSGDKEAERIKKIQDRLNNIENQRKALDETERAVFTSRQLEGDKKRRLEYERDPGKDFLKSVQLFIRDQIADQRQSTWKRPDRRFLPSSGILHKGKATVHDSPVPLLAVYFDRSASWDDAKIKVGQQAIANLRRYEKRGLIKLKVFYFADDISSDPEDPELGGGTTATQKILDHIKRIKANNVIIMTDSDMNTQGEFTNPVTVSGAVWFLFKGGRCNTIMEYLKGKRLYKVYDL